MTDKNYNKAKSCIPAIAIQMKTVNHIEFVLLLYSSFLVKLYGKLSNSNYSNNNFKKCYIYTNYADEEG